MNVLQRVSRFTDLYRVFPFVTFMRILTTSTTVIFSLLLVYFLKNLVQAIEVWDQSAFINTIIVASVSMVSLQVFGFIFRNYYWVVQQFVWEMYLNRKYLKQFVQFDQGKIEMLWTGKTLSILEKWIEEYVDIALWVLSYVVRIVFTLWFGFFLLRWLPWYIVAGSFVMMIVIFSVIVYLNKYTTFYRFQRKENNVKITGLFAKIIMSKFEILQNNSIIKEIAKLDSIYRYSWDLARRQTFWSSFLFQIPKFLLSCVLVGGYYYLWLRVFGTVMSLSDMIAILAVLGLFEVTLRDTIEYYEGFTRAFVHVDKLWDFVDTTPMIVGYDVGKTYHFQQGKYELRDLSFSYHDRALVLDNFSCTIQWGKKTALVGRSGGGKTTLMKLLAGYMRPTSGVLCIDGQDVTDIRLDSYYPHIGYLTQEPSVFDGTIEENLLYSAKGKMTKKKMEEAIELSECQFIYELEHGIHTEIGERGIRLSGGQKQRLAIAKIFLKNPEIILLDEPTAALDSYSEQKVALAFERLFEGRTVIVIAHRLQTVKEADDIIVLEKGKIVERGTHRQLLKLWKKYAGMVDLQSGTVKEG